LLNTENMQKNTMKVLSAMMIVLTLVATLGSADTATAVTASDTITLTLPVDATISISSPADVTMGAITGTGKSDLTTNSATWTVATNNSAGYQLAWKSVTNGTGGRTLSTLENTTGDSIAHYTPAVADTPEAWALSSATSSEWGARLSATSDIDGTVADPTMWGDGTGVATTVYNGTGTGAKWLNVATSDRIIASRNSETTFAGDSEVVTFGAEVGSTMLQSTGSYKVDVTMTATTL
jgi:hypothetical protein